jgi:hypothetical protein
MVLTVAIHEFTASRRKAQAELHVCSELTFFRLDWRQNDPDIVLRR